MPLYQYSLHSLTSLPYPCYIGIDIQHGHQRHYSKSKEHCNSKTGPITNRDNIVLHMKYSLNHSADIYSVYLSIRQQRNAQERLHPSCSRGTSYCTAHNFKHETNGRVTYCPIQGKRTWSGRSIIFCTRITAIFRYNCKYHTSLEEFGRKSSIFRRKLP